MRNGTEERCARGLLVALTILLASACSSPITIGPATTAIPETATAVAEVETATPEETTPTDVPATATAVVEPTAAPVTIQCTVLNVRGLRLRAGPGTEYGIVTTLTANEALTASGKSTEADWIAVSTGSGAQGWVAASYINCGDGVPQLPVATPASAP
jgi:uncharacterized protein YgiM (DUF1202 family)